MKIEKNLIIAAVCGLVIGAGGFALFDKGTKRANPHHAFHAPHQMANVKGHNYGCMPNARPMAQRPMQERVEIDMAEAFATFDANSDKKLELSELPNHLAQRFDRMDTDSDGFITLEEFEAVRALHVSNARGQMRNVENRNVHRDTNQQNRQNRQNTTYKG